MFLYEIKDDVFKTYVLSNDNKTTYIEVVPERGGIITNFVVNGKPIFYLDKSTLIDKEKNIRGGNPILFPICSYLKKNTYALENNTYNMKQHGFARNLPWEVSDVQVSEDSASISLELEENNTTLEQYPFAFKLVYKYVLSQNSLEISSTFVNMNNKPMPFYGGFHPYFYISDKDKVNIEIPSTSYTETIDHSLVEGKFNFAQDEITVIYDDLQSDTCSMVDDVAKHRVSLNFDSAYKYLVVWSLKGRDFICIEPWMASTDAFNTGEGVVYLNSGEEITCEFNIDVDAL